MRPTDQTFDGERGNCLCACFASILEIPLDTVPDFGALHDSGGSWTRALQQWLSPMNLGYIVVAPGALKFRIPECYHVIGGGSPRGCTSGHAVVGFAGKAVFDPHPSRAGLTNIDEFGFLIKLAALANKQSPTEEEEE